MSRISSQKLITYLCFAIFAAIIVLPPIIHGYIYPTMGDDSGMHLNILKTENLWNQLYFGYVVIGYPLKWFYDFTLINYNQLFLWLNYLVLIGVGFSFFFVLSRLVNWKAGLFALFIPFFIALGIWWEFDDGMIFNLINMGIVLPFLFYFGIWWIKDNKTYHLVGLLLLSMFFSLFHSTGIYLTPTIVVLLVAGLVFKKNLISRRIVITSSAIIIINLIGDFILVRQTNSILPQIVSFSFIGKLYPFHYYIEGLSLIGIIMLVISLLLIYQYKLIRRESVLLLVGLSAMFLVLLAATLGISPSPDRQLFDMAILFGVVTSICAGIIANYRRVYLLFMLGLLAIGLFINLPNWFDYRSAVGVVDERAIDYVNKLEAETFTVSPTIAPLIYKEFIKDKYVEGQADILIVRNLPMTPVSDKNSVAYVPHGTDSIQGYSLDKTFTDNKVEVQIYRRNN